MAARIFKAKLQTVEGRNFVYVAMPFSVERVFRRRGRVPVTGTINGVPFRSSVFPALGRLAEEGLAGKYFLVVNPAMREKLRKRPGSTVRVVIDLDTRKRTVEIPAELGRLLKRERLLATFNPLPYTQRKEYVQWVEDAKNPETRQRRMNMILLAMKRKRARSERSAERPTSTGAAPASQPRRHRVAQTAREERKSKGPSKQKVSRKKSPSK